MEIKESGEILKTDERLRYLVCEFIDPLNPYAHYEINPNLTIG